ncbi:MAG TPA: hypothetical protein VF006_13885 [Longimicrobium sp.]
MRSMFRRTGIGLAAAAVMGSLGFGTSSAMAQVRLAAACGDPLADGSCTTTSACARYCKGTVGAGTGQCSGGCCYCIWF